MCLDYFSYNNVKFLLNNPEVALAHELNIYLVATKLLGKNQINIVLTETDVARISVRGQSTKINQQTLMKIFGKFIRV